MSKEIINKDGTLFKQRTTPDWQEGYEQGLLAGFTKSIVLIRHLQRTLSPRKDPNSQRVTQQEILDEAMELIAIEIKANTALSEDQEGKARRDQARLDARRTGDPYWLQ